MSLNVQYETKQLSLYAWDDRGCSGHLRCNPHLHQNLEIVYLKSGTTVAYADSVRYQLSDGDLFFTFPNQIHSYESFGREEYRIVIVSPDLVPEFATYFSESLPVTSVIHHADRFPEIIRAMEQLIGIYDRATGREKPPLPFDEQLKRGALLTMFSYMMRQVELTGLPEEESDTLRAIISYCAQNFTHSLSLESLEKELHLNKYYISHLFSGKLGIRFNAYINSLRVSEACRYLTNSDHGVTEISSLVGFDTLRTFNRAFSKQTGVTPSEYRKSYKNSQNNNKIKSDSK